MLMKKSLLVLLGLSLMTVACKKKVYRCEFVTHDGIVVNVFEDTDKDRVENLCLYAETQIKTSFGGKAFMGCPDGGQCYCRCGK
jgi:hypothetical protein